MNVTIYSDASICQQQGIVGWAGWIKSDRGTLLCSGVLKTRTVDTGISEAMAMVNAMSRAIATGNIADGDLVVISTDNDSVPDILEGKVVRRITHRKRRNARGNYRRLRKDIAKANSQIATISAYYRLFIASHDLSVRWTHVKGHRGTTDRRAAVNHGCDTRAKAKMRQARSALKAQNTSEPVNQAALSPLRSSASRKMAITRSA